MSTRAKLVFIVFGIITLIGGWVFLMMNSLGGGNLSGDILGGTSNLSGDNQTVENLSGNSVDDISPNNIENIIDKPGVVDSENSSNDSEKNINNPKTNKKLIELSMPSYFYNKGFDNIKKKLAKQGIFVKVNKFKSLDDYKKSLKKEYVEGSDTDIALVPIDWIYSLSDSTYKIGFQSDISPKFSYLFNDYINHDDYTLIPYAIDPFVIYTQPNAIDNYVLSMNDLKENLYTGDGKSKKLFEPVKSNFGISNKDVMMLKLGNEVYENYFLILYNIIFQSYLSQDSSVIKTFQKIASDDNVKFYDFSKVKLFNKRAKKNNKYCEHYANICLLTNGFSQIGFGMLSDLDIYDDLLLGSKVNLNDLDVNNFMSISNEYPVRGWGFVINNKSEQLAASTMFLGEYMDQVDNGNRFLWNNVLSPFNSVFQKQRLNPKLEKIINFENKFLILEGSFNLQKDFISETKIVEVLNGTYSIEAFLDNLDWIF